MEEWLEAPRLDPGGAPRAAVLEVAERVLGWLGRRVVTGADASWFAALEQAQGFLDALQLDGRARLDRASLEQLL